MDQKIKILRGEDIPKRLLEIPKPPKAISIRGALPEESMIYLTVIGSRKYTRYGKEVIEKLISSLRGRNVVIVSGLALGIDSLAHEEAIKNGLKTIAFPGSGLDPKFIYPRTNFSLAEKIVSSGGALVSEFALDQRATRWTFPQRNRLMAGISDAILIIEAEAKSGSLITTTLGLDYNKNILTVPGPIFSETSIGTNNLLKQGATPITNAKDLLEALGLAKEKDTEEEIDLEDLTDEERTLLENLKEPRDKDELIRLSGMPASKAQIVITSMELKGLIKEELGEIRRNF